MGFDPYLSLIRDGEAVSAAVTNRPTATLDRNLRYVYDLLRASAVGATVVAPGMGVEPAAGVGAPVYYNPAAARFERGLAGFVTDPVTGRLAAAASALVWGVVYRKAAATTADILLFGYATLDLSGVVDGAVAAGVYYLSGVAPGRLTSRRPAAAVPVLRSDGAGGVFVTPPLVDAFDGHTHFRFALACVPAGTTRPPGGGERHAIEDADAALPGWLPADHPSFNGHAPAGYAFGYNLAADPALAAAWPPLPAGGAYLEWDKGLDKDVAGTGVPLGPDGLVVIDEHGIWWKSDCQGDVPWPADYDSAAPAHGSDSLSDSEYPCPRPLRMGLTLWFARPDFATDGAVVTRLGSRSPRLRVTCPDGTPASAGDLVLDLDLDLVAAAGADGATAFKTFDPATGTFTAGPVVEGVYALSDNVTLTGAASRPVDRADPAGPRAYQGLVGIAVAPETTRELDIQLIRLDAVEEQFFEETPYLGFPPADASAIRCKVQLPASLGLASPQLRLRLRLLGRIAGGLPALTLTARRAPRPAGKTPLPLPDDATEFAVPLDTTATLTQANQYVEAESDPFPVAAGDLVYFTLGRTALDGYAAEVGLLQQVAVLAGGA